MILEYISTILHLKSFTTEDQVIISYFSLRIMDD
jgi:hypothetical protein